MEKLVRMRLADWSSDRSQNQSMNRMRPSSLSNSMVSRISCLRCFTRSDSSGEYLISFLNPALRVIPARGIGEKQRSYEGEGAEESLESYGKSPGCLAIELCEAEIDLYLIISRQHCLIERKERRPNKQEQHH